MVFLLIQLERMENAITSTGTTEKDSLRFSRSLPDYIKKKVLWKKHSLHVLFGDPNP